MFTDSTRDLIPLSDFRNLKKENTHDSNIITQSLKNVPKALIQQIENPPSIKDKDDEDDE